MLEADYHQSSCRNISVKNIVNNINKNYDKNINEINFCWWIKSFLGEIYRILLQSPKRCGIQVNGPSFYLPMK